jgi:rare lipoprotein A
MTRHSILKASPRLAIPLVLALTLGACQGGFENPFRGNSDSSETGDNGPVLQDSTRLVERDVETPEVFQVTEPGLWDGRPSLGGVWVAHPDTTDPERVIIRNESNGRFVIGALFRRERDVPGPSLQVSSDAAAALNLIAGSPTTLNVTALRRQEVAEPIAAPATNAPGAPEEIESRSLDPIGAAAAAIDAAETETAVAPVVTAATAPAPSVAPQASSLDRPYIQIGIFNVEANADNTAQALRTSGLIPTIYTQESSGRPFWRVVVGPARNTSERATLLSTVRGLGFSDAYFVTN